MSTVRNLPRILLPSGLAGYMALATSILCAVLTIILVALVQNQARDHVRESIGFGLGELAQQAADKLDRGMYERYREVKLLARRIADLGPQATLESQRRMLDDAHRSYDYYSWMGIATVDGKVQVSARGLLEGANVAARPWFKNALSGVHIGDVHEALLLAKLLPSVNGEPQRFVDVAFPISAPDGGPRAVLGAHLSWQWARDVERSVVEPIQEGRQVDALIVDAKGLVLLGPPGLQGTTIDTDSLRRARNGRAIGYVLERWSDGKEYLVGYRQTDGYADYPGLGWTVLLRRRRAMPMRQCTGSASTHCGPAWAWRCYSRSPAPWWRTGSPIRSRTCRPTPTASGAARRRRWCPTSVPTTRCAAWPAP